MKRPLYLAAVGLVLLLAPSTSPAATSDNIATIEKARASFHQGVQLYSEGSFEAALAEFRKAYQIAPNYKLLYNIAQTYFDLHDYVNSFKNLKQYVQEGGSDLPPERRRQVNELSQKLEDRIASLDITCNVDGVDIRVDDLSVGVSPLPSPVLVNAGPRRITAIKPGYAVSARIVTVVGKEKVKVNFDVAALLKGTPSDRAAGDDATDGTALGVQGGMAPPPPKRIGLITSLVATSGCALATGVFGVLASHAKSEFNRELNRIPNTKDNVDGARSTMKTYAGLTDAFAAATVISASMAVYFLLTDPAPAKPAAKKSSIALAPTVGGVSLFGQW